MATDTERFKKMTVVYPLTIQHDYSELRYSLRSIDKYLKPKEVVIVGDYVPEWINNVAQIHLPDVPGRKQLSIRRKILAALEYSEKILFMNDDVILTKPATEFPYYWHGSLKGYAESGAKTLYKELTEIKKPVKNFDGHRPLVYERNKFIEASERFTDNCIIKSFYCNYFEIQGIEQPDCKLIKAEKQEVIKNFILNTECFSTGAYSLPSALPIMKELFPLKSNFEL